MAMRTDSARLWSIVLAGGEGERTRAFVENWLGYHKPKQYCAFTGSRSLFQHTVDRADALSSPERRVVIAAPEHQKHLREQLRGREGGRVILQPRNRGTASGVFLALAYVLARDPNATVVIYPSDHFVCPEGAFLTTMRDAVRAAERYSDRPLLLGVRPTTAEEDYGWIVPSPCAREGPTRRVGRFLEKPPRRLAEEALRKGGLWNTMILASKLEPLWALGWSCLPEILPAFVRFREALRSGRDEIVLEEIYRDLPSRDFSSDLLQRAPDALRVFEMRGVWWSDWGRPERILETLRALERPAAFPEALVLEREAIGSVVSWRSMMKRKAIVGLWLGAAVSLASCAAPERSPSGFRLPEGNVEAGQAAFLELQCNACHEVRGLDLPGPVADPPVPVALGGTVDYQPTDGRFVTSIVNPSHKLAPGHPRERIESGGISRMADYSDVMTVRQLVDLVAFLHSRYEFVPRTTH